MATPYFCNAEYYCTTDAFKRTFVFLFILRDTANVKFFFTNLVIHLHDLEGLGFGGVRGRFCVMMAGMGNDAKKTIAVLGGGAAGLAAAIAAAEALRAAGASARVMVYEADERVGRSILATGNGRCNFSNAHVEADVYRNAAFVGDALAELRRQACAADGVCPLADNPVHEFFADLGLLWREESEGRLYPLANKASSVLDVLRAAARERGVVEECACAAVRVDAPSKPGERFHARFADGRVAHADAVVVAAGGRAARELAPAGTPYSEPQPVLGPLRTDTGVVKQLNNIRVRCAVELWGKSGEAVANAVGFAEHAAGGRSFKAREEGEVLFRDYGVSGIAVFNLSRFAEPGDLLLIDLLPAVPAAECESFLHARRKRLAAAGRTVTGDDLLRGMLLPAVAQAVLKEAGLRENTPLAKANVPALARALKAFPLVVRGMGDARQCQVSRGGFAVEAFDACTMEAQGVPGLHVVGEALDVDAPCGGYNLHWAWASGILAGRHAARIVEAGR